ncbi:hypothetical protein H1235_11730 [Pseudoxanthomonas sp. NC8]|nr:hypothetical protein H1235_11730 [Pseudoxanthomonas sp. NC8]
MDHAQYPAQVVEDIIRLRRRIQRAGLPPRRTDGNIIVGTWNIQKFGGLHLQWSENPSSPKRNLRCLTLIAEPRSSTASTWWPCRRCSARPRRCAT